MAILWLFFLVWFLLSFIETLRQDPGGSLRQLFAILGMTLGVAAVVTLPWFFVPWAVIDAHQGPFIGGLLLVTVLGVVVITIVANRLRRRALAQRSGGTRGGPPTASTPG